MLHTECVIVRQTASKWEIGLSVPPFPTLPMEGLVHQGRNKGFKRPECTDREGQECIPVKSAVSYEIKILDFCLWTALRIVPFHCQSVSIFLQWMIFGTPHSEGAELK